MLIKVEKRANDDSIQKRYLIKTCVMVVVAILNAGIQVVLPRAMTIGEYANYSYNLNIFTSVLSISFCSMDSAFAAKISKRTSEKSIISFYGRFIWILIVLLNVGTTVLCISGVGDKWFTGQKTGVIVLALNAAISLKLLTEMGVLFDCYVLTRYSEPFMLLQKLCFAVLIYISYVNKILSLELFYLEQIGVAVFFVIILLLVFIYIEGFSYMNDKKENGKYAFEFWRYCRPLLISSILTNGLLIFSNWILMSYGGEIEQAYYGVAMQLNNMIIFVFSPLIALLQREYAVRTESSKILGQFYNRITLITFYVVSFISIFVMMNAEYVLRGLFGDSYCGAIRVTKFMMLATIFQAWSQTSGAMYSATERTSAIAKISIINQILSLALIYMFQLPNFIWVNGLGAVGIGVQKMLANLFSAAMMAYVNCTYLKISFRKQLLNIIGILSIEIIYASVSRHIGRLLLRILKCDEALFQCIFQGGFYVVVAVCILRMLLRINMKNNKEMLF